MAKKGTTAALGFEEKLWAAADKLRGHMDASDYKHVVLGLVFLKYISDSFMEVHLRLQDEDGADPEDRDEYLAEGVFWVPEKARWDFLQANAKQPTIGKLIDDAMTVIETENTKLRGVLPKDFARQSLDKTMLGELVDLIGTIGLGDEQSKSEDILGRVYEYFLGKFASREGKGSGEFYTPQSVVRLIVEMLEPYKGRVYDPCCGSGGFFVQSERFVEEHQGRVGDISVYGQESNPTTWKLAQMNLAIRGIEGNLGESSADTFHNDQHKDLKADFILANPHFNDGDWGGGRLREDVRWKFGLPPESNANFAWIQHIIHHLSPSGTAGFVLANGSLKSNQSGEGEIRRAIVEANLVDCIVALPTHLFYTTQIPVCLWFLSRNRAGQNGTQERRQSTLFIDARRMGVMAARKHRVLTDDDVTLIAETYRSWRREAAEHPYCDAQGFSKSASLDEIRDCGYDLSPSRYVGSGPTAVEPDPERVDATIQSLRHSVQLLADAQRNVLGLLDSLRSDADLVDLSDWETVPLADVLVPRNERVDDREIAEYSCTNHGLVRRDLRFSKKLSASNAKNKVIRAGDLVFGLSRAVLNFGLMREDIGCVSPAYRVYTVNETVIPADYLELLMRVNHDYFYRAVSSSSREGQSISVDALEALEVSVPPPDRLDTYRALAAPILDYIECLQVARAVASTGRDELFPAFMSGALVPKAGQKVKSGGGL